MFFEDVDRAVATRPEFSDRLDYRAGTKPAFVILPGVGVSADEVSRKNSYQRFRACRVRIVLPTSSAFRKTVSNDIDRRYGSKIEAEVVHHDEATARRSYERGSRLERLLEVAKTYGGARSVERFRFEVESLGS